MKLDKGPVQDQQTGLAEWQLLQEWDNSCKQPQASGRSFCAAGQSVHVFVRNGQLTIFRIMLLTTFSSKNDNIRNIVTLNNMYTSRYKLTSKSLVSAMV